MSPVPTPPIAILGAGPAGLTLARLLEQQNIDYVVFERDIDGLVANQGGSLDLHKGTGQLALEEAGLIDEFKKHARWDCVTSLADKQGNVVLSLSQESDRPEIDRKALRKILLDSIPGHRVQWGSKINDVTKGEDGKMSVHLKNGKIESGFRLVVGADGAWSKARSLVTSATPQYSGKSYITSHIRPGNPHFATLQSLAGTGSYIALGDERFLMAQYAEGSYLVGLGMYIPEHWVDEDRLLKDPTALKQWLLKEQMEGWPEVHLDFVKHADDEWRRWPLYALPSEELKWGTVGGVALIGDAAHVTTPFKGEGANCAMHDSVDLAQQIRKYGIDHLDEAVAEYEKTMLPRGADLIRRSAESGDMLFAKDAPYGWIKKTVGDS